MRHGCQGDGLKKARTDWLSPEFMPEGSLPAAIVGKVQAWDKALPVAWYAACVAAYRSTTDAHKALEGDYPPFYKDVGLFKDCKLADLGKEAPK